MIALDANVVLRFLLGDDPDQARRATAVISENDVFVCKTVLIECNWTLMSGYRLSQQEARQRIAAFLGLSQVRVEDPDGVRSALDSEAEFADALHLTSMGPATSFATFDKGFIARHGTNTPMVFEP